MHTTVTPVLQFPTPQAQPQPSRRPLFLDPDCPFHYSERPFAPGQMSTAHVLRPAQEFAEGMTGRLYANVKNPHKGLPICEDVLRGYLAAAFNAGYAAALDQEFADVFAESDPELGTR